MSLKLNSGQSLIIATFNPGKVREIDALLEGRFVVKSAAEAGLSEPEETETSFIGNAILKARHAADASGEVALADDSGLSVAALGGAPGVYSARWAGPHRDFERAMEIIEIRISQAREADPQGFTDRAWFTSSLAVAWPHGAVVAVEGRVDGRLRFPAAGTNGFGYDPIFMPDGHEISFGEMAPLMKDALSHRARAFEKLKAALF